MKRIFTAIFISLLAIFQIVIPGRDLFANQSSSSAYNDYSSEIQELKEAYQLMKDDYEARLRSLENRIIETEVAFKKEIEKEAVHEKQFYGTKGSIMNPDFSVIADTFYHFSDQADGVGEFTDNDLYFREVELAIQGYIYPGIRAEFFPVWELEEDKVEIEEAFADFLTLPFNTSLKVGRQRVDFGLVNPIHQHRREYVDVPLVVQNFLGAEGYIDEGFDVETMLPVIPFPLTIGFGVFDGDKSLSEEGDEEDEEGADKTSEIFNTSPVEWEDHVFLAKLNANIPLFRSADMSLGYHAMWDDNGDGTTIIHNAQFALRYRLPNSYKKLLWQSELYVADIDDRDVKSKGFYSMLDINLSRFLNTGLRYDWSELGDNDDVHQWAINPFVTWHLTEASYVRMQYKYGELEDSLSVNEAMIQFVWGLGPHSHSLKN